MSKGRTLSQLISAGAVLADGQISASEIVGMVSVLKVTGTTYPGDDLAANPSGGQTITLTGSNFISTPTVYVGDTIAPSVTFVSSTQLTFTAPAKTAGTYSVYVVNPDGTTAILVNGISYSGTPTWTTAAGSLGTVDANFTFQLQAAGDVPVIYSLTAGSTLPSGVTLSSSGLITGTAIGTDQTFSFSVDAIDAQRQETPRSFQVTVVLADPFFRYTTLLLQADPVIAPFNSDASTNAFNLTLNGDVRSDSFTPYQTNGYWSVGFTGAQTSPSLTYPSISAYDLGSTSQWTYECWVYFTNTSGEQSIIERWSGTGGPGWLLTKLSTNVYRAHFGASVYIDTGAIAVAGQWIHLAVSRDGSTASIFVNGVRQGTTNSVVNFSDGTDPLVFGERSTGSQTLPLNGYISNARIVKNTYVYNPSLTSITVPTSPLTAITNTVFLGLQSNRYTDNSSNNATATASSASFVQNFSPFTNPTNTSSYGSAYFDGAGDYLSVPDSDVFWIEGDFTFEAWFYQLSSKSVSIIGQLPISGTASFIFRVDSTGKLSFFYELVGGVGSNGTASTSTIAYNSWNHLVWTRSGTTFKYFINGVQDATTQTISGPFKNGTGPVNIGLYNTGADTYMNGYIADARFVKGTSLYSTTFTPPTAPLTAVTNTSLLTLQYNGGGNNSGFEDSSQFNWPVTRVGNSTQGTFTPYGTGWSNYFNGSSTYLSFPSNAALAVSSSADYTVEGWINFSTVASGGIFQTTSNTSVATGPLWFGYYSGNLTVAQHGSATYNVSHPWTPTAGVWYHVAATRTSGTVRLFIDGVLVKTDATTQNGIAFTQAGAAIGLVTTPSYLTGYLSNVRFVNGSSLYSAVFTPSTTPLTAVTNTVVLACQSSRFIDNSSNAFAITTNGSPSVQRFDPFPPTAAYSTSVIGGSAYFDGTGDYLTIANNAALSFGTGDFCVEAYVYKQRAANEPIIDSRASNNAAPWALYIDGSNLPYFYDGTSYTSSIAITLNAWNHVAVTRSAGTLRIFVNGVQGYSATVTTNLDRSSGVQVIGATVVTYANPWLGYMSDLRIVKGSAIYTSAFTPPTAPLTTTTNTSLLMSYTNSGIYDGAMLNNLETVGNTQVSTGVKKYGNGSLYFDGTGDWLSIPNSPVLDFGAENFTAEFWAYPTATGSYLGIYSKRTVNTNYGPFQVLYHTGSMSVFMSNTGSSWQITITASSTTPINQWTHVAVVRSGTTVTIYLNGVSAGSSTGMGTSAVMTNTSAAAIGADSASGSNGFAGYIDDLRITKGVARYTANFTPPALALKAR